MHTLRVALIQSHLAWHDVERNLSHFSQVLAQTDADVMVLPEMFSTGFTMETNLVQKETAQNILDWMKREAQKHATLLIGSTIYTEDNQTYYNRCFAVQPDGRALHYDKKYLFSMAGEHKTYTAGSTPLIINYHGWKIQPMVCYDLRFSELADHPGTVDCLFYTASWPGKRIQHWDILLRARAVENLSYVCAVNRVGKDGNNFDYPGHSQVINPMGEIEAKVVEDETVILHSLSKELLDETRRKLPFLNDK